VGGCADSFWWGAVFVLVFGAKGVVVAGLDGTGIEQGSLFQVGSMAAIGLEARERARDFTDGGGEVFAREG
jgi:hypothetical protein